MKKIQVTVREKDKGGKDLSLLNIRDELVNVLYKETVANATKADLQFYVLLYFASLKSGEKTLLEKVLDEAIPKFKALNTAFGERKGMLGAGDYAEMVEYHGLSNIFKYDVFFVLIEAISNLDEITQRYSGFLEKNTQAQNTLNEVQDKYGRDLSASMESFRSSKIEDDRYDDFGNYHDLSKSVYRTIRMRNSRNLDLNLQRYTSVKEVTSRSPIDFTFFQHIDPQILFDLWTKYHLADYTKLVAKEAFEFGKDHFEFNVNLGDVFNAWLIYQLVPSKERKEKAKAKANLDVKKTKKDNETALVDLTQTLVDSILKSNERLEKEVDENKKELKKMRSEHLTVQSEEKIKKLERRIEELENLSVDAEIIDEDNESKK
jgi:hypothetical protein